MTLTEITVAIFTIKKKKDILAKVFCQTLERVISRALPVGKEEELNGDFAEGALGW